MSAFWYELKTWDDKTFWLKPERGLAAQALYEQGKDISLGAVGVFAYKDIRSIVETDSPYAPPAAAVIGAGEQRAVRPISALPANTVLFVYVKKKLSKREFEVGKYSFLPSYWLLDQDEGDIWVARTHPMRSDNSLPNGFERCTAEESDRIDHMRSR